ncbi:MAG: endonuclease [Candidatus Cloacimonetes bacterium]|nr:endonuclease [Candidatus Cloacimonadota bacterium]
MDTNTYSSYDGAKVFLFQELDNNSGTVTCVYTGKIYPIEDDYSGQSNPNTEHTFAQSWFTPETNVKKSDLHHLFITTMQVNSSRGNLPFGNVASTAASDVYYDDTPWQSYRGRDTWQHTVFQVNPHFRGNTARAILYFHTRYGDSLTQGGVNMLDTMIDWHYADPPDEAERNRNDMLYSFQGNRNPFVDRPEFVNRIWNPSPSDDPVVDLVPALRIDNIYPNPFREVLNVAIDAKPGSKISAGIYNLKGQLVYSTFLEDNQRDFSWNGKDGYGNEMPSGLYFIRISGNDGTDIAKVLYTK